MSAARRSRDAINNVAHFLVAKPAASIGSFSEKPSTNPLPTDAMPESPSA